MVNDCERRVRESMNISANDNESSLRMNSSNYNNPGKNDDYGIIEETYDPIFGYRIEFRDGEK